MSSRGSTGPMQTISGRRSKIEPVVVLNQYQIMDRINRHCRNDAHLSRTFQAVADLPVSTTITPYLLASIIRRCKND